MKYKAKALRKQHRTPESAKPAPTSQRNKCDWEGDRLPSKTEYSLGTSRKGIHVCLSQHYKRSNEICMPKNPSDFNLNKSKVSFVRDLVSGNTTATTTSSNCLAFKPSFTVKPSSCFSDQAHLKRAVFTPDLESGSTETLALAELNLESRPLQAEEESSDFFKSRTSSSVSGEDIATTTTIASTLNSARSQHENRDCSKARGIITTNSSNVNKNARSSGCKGSSGSKTKDSTIRAKGERCPPAKKASKNSKIFTAATASCTNSNTTTSSSNKSTAGADFASGSAAGNTSNISLSASSSTIAATLSSDNDSTGVSTAAGISTSSTVSSSSSSSTSSASSTTLASSGISSNTSASGLSTMSAMDLLMQLDLPTVSDSSDTEDFLQELAAINDSGRSENP